MSNLSNAVFKERASDLLHCMATSRDVLFWTSRGQLPRNERIIPMTNTAELVEYVLLPHNDDVTQPRALNTFLDGLAELGVDKGVIKNKKVLSDLIEKENGYRNGENTSENESNVESSSGREQEEIASANGNEAEDTQESDNDTENDSEETEGNSHETSTTFHSENPCEHCENSNVYGTLIMK